MAFSWPFSRTHIIKEEPKAPAPPPPDHKCSVCRDTGKMPWVDGNGTMHFPRCLFCTPPPWAKSAG